MRALRSKATKAHITIYQVLIFLCTIFSVTCPPFPNLKTVQQVARMTNSITLQAGIVAGTIPADEAVGELFNLEPDQVAHLKTIDSQQVKQYSKDLKELKNNVPPLSTEARQLEIVIVKLEKWNRMYAEVGDVKDAAAGTKYFKDVEQASGKGLDKDFMKNSGTRLGTYSGIISSLTSSNPSNQDAMRELNYLPGLSDLSTRIGTDLSSWVNNLRQLDPLTQSDYVVDSPQSKLVHVLDEVRAAPLGSSSSAGQTAQKELATNALKVHQLFSTTPKDAIDILNRIVTLESRRSAIPLKYTSGLVNGYADLGRIQEDFGNATQLLGGLDPAVLLDGLIHVRGLFNQSLVDTILPLQEAESILAERMFRGLTSQFDSFQKPATEATMSSVDSFATKTIPNADFSKDYSKSIQESSDLRSNLLSINERIKYIQQLHTESSTMIAEMKSYLPADAITDINTVPGHITKFQQFKNATILLNNLENMKSMMDGIHGTLTTFDINATIATLSGKNTTFDNFVSDTKLKATLDYFENMKKNGTDIKLASEAVQMIRIARDLDDRMVNKVDSMLNGLLSAAPQITSTIAHAVSLKNGQIVEIDELKRLKDLGRSMKVLGDSSMALDNIDNVRLRKSEFQRFAVGGDGILGNIDYNVREPRKNSVLKRAWSDYEPLKTTLSGMFADLETRMSSIDVVEILKIAGLNGTFSAFIGLLDVTLRVDNCRMVLEELGQILPTARLLKEQLDDFASLNLKFASSTAPLAQVATVLPQLDLVFSSAAAISPNAPPPVQAPGPISSSNSTTASPKNSQGTTQSDESNIWMIVGICVGVILVVAVIMASLYFFLAYKKAHRKSEKDDVEAGKTGTNKSGDSSDATAQQAQQVPQAVPVESNESVKDSGESNEAVPVPVEQAGEKVDQMPVDKKSEKKAKKAAKTASKNAERKAEKKGEKKGETPAVPKTPKVPEDITKADYWFKYAKKKPAFDKGGNSIGFVDDPFPKGQILKELNNALPELERWRMLPEYDTTKSRVSQCLTQYLEVKEEKQTDGKVKKISTRKNAKRSRWCLKRTAVHPDLDLNTVKGVLTEYIVGSAPTESTIDPFMNYLLKSKCKQVVMCCTDEESYQYLPKKIDGKKKIGKLTVELKSREVSHNGQFVLCTFYIHAPGQASKPMMHIQLAKWERGDELSEYLQAAIADAHRLTALSEDPVLVLSQDGNERAATFAGSQIGYEYKFSSEKYNTALPSVEQAFLRLRSSRYGSVQSPKTFLHMLWLPLSWLKNSECIPEFREPEVKKKFEKLTRIVNNCDKGPEKSDKEDWKKHCSMLTRWKELNESAPKKEIVLDPKQAEARERKLERMRLNESNKTMKNIRRKMTTFTGQKDTWTSSGPLGEGAYGQVLDVTNEQTAPGALKHAGYNNIELKQEKRVLESNASDPHAPQLLDHGKDKDTDSRFVVMTKCKKLEGPRNLAEHLRISMECVRTLHKMHNRGFLHRDIKWENTGMSAVKGSQRILFFDLGLARQYAMQTKSGHVLRYPRGEAPQRGTVHFASLSYHEMKEMGRKDDYISLIYMLANMIDPLPWIHLEDENEIYEMKKKESYRYFHEMNPFVAETYGPIYDMLQTYSYSDRPDSFTIFAMLKLNLSRLGEHFDGVNEDPAYLDAAFEEMDTVVIPGGTGLILPRQLAFHDSKLDDVLSKCMQTRTEAPQMRRHPKAIQNLGELMKTPFIYSNTKNRVFKFFSLLGFNFPIVPEDQWSQGDTISVRADSSRRDAGAEGVKEESTVERVKEESTVERDDRSDVTRCREKIRARRVMETIKRKSDKRAKMLNKERRLKEREERRERRLKELEARQERRLKELEERRKRRLIEFKEFVF